MTGHKKRKTTIVDTADADYEKSIGELADLVVAEMKHSYRSDLEPFEAYAERVKSQLHKDMVEFRDRFHRGYRVLLEEIAKSQEEGPPSGTIRP